MKKITIKCLFGFIALLGFNQLNAQGVTTSSVAGRIKDSKGEFLVGANIQAEHLPSGSLYGNSTDDGGYFRIPGMRVGGPYKITITYTGYKEKLIENVTLSLGTTATFNVELTEDAIELSGLEIIADKNDVFSGNRTGAATNFNSKEINALPTLSRNVLGFVGLTPQANGSSFGGQDNRLNNITIDGSIFNNSFGLAGQPGGRTGVAPISLDAIEELQVNIAPFDVRQSGFVGAGVNAVTRSGTNEFSGSAYYFTQNRDWIGTKAKEATVTAGQFTDYQAGFRLGGPIIKNKLFFFASGEIDRNTTPNLLVANNGSQAQSGNVTSVLASDLKGVSDFLRTNFNYETGPYQDYNMGRFANKLLLKLDYNLNKSNKISIRYTYLDSDQDVFVSGSSSLGLGGRRGPNALSFQNSNYIINDDIQSIVGEWNTVISNKISNNFIVGYTYNNEDRGTYGEMFPLIEILRNGASYIAAGFEPFTPNNKLNYKTFQMSDNLSFYLGKHTISTGFNVENLSFENVFFPGSQGVFVYNSLAEFYSDLNDYKANPTRTASPVSLRRFQYRYSGLPGGAEPVQPTQVLYAGLYVQDEINVSEKLKLSLGLRADLPIFEPTGFENTKVSSELYLLNDNYININTAKLPESKILYSPRVGFNYDVKGDKTLQLRGGTGLFTGRPVFVWISNQIGNNGVLTGFEQIDNTRTRPFTTTPGQFVTNPTLPSSYELAVTAPDFKFLQTLRSNLAMDVKLPLGIIGTFEALYSRNVNGYIYYDVNKRDPSGKFSGIDTRPRYPASGLSGAAANNAIRINPSTVNAIYLANTNQGDGLSLTASFKKTFKNGLFASLAYNYGRARDMMSAGSIAAGSFNGVPSVNGNNFVDLAFSDNDRRHRVLAIASYRLEYGDFGATQFGLTIDGFTGFRYSYTINGDMNGDAINNNDLLFIPNRGSDIKFTTLTTGGITFTPEQQATAFEAFIAQDKYLNANRGKYAARNGAMAPGLIRAQFSIVQEFFVKVGKKRNTIQLRADISNFGNMLNSNWGVSQSVIASRPLSFVSAGTDGVPTYRMWTISGSDGKQKLLDKSFQFNASLGDVYQAQIGVRYIFN
jgi:hypothetical protein